MSPTWERCSRGNVDLQELVGSGLCELQQRLDDLGRTLPRFVLSELESFTRCGDPAAASSVIWSGFKVSIMTASSWVSRVPTLVRFTSVHPPDPVGLGNASGL